MAMQKLCDLRARDVALMARDAFCLFVKIRKTQIWTQVPDSRWVMNLSQLVMDQAKYLLVLLDKINFGKISYSLENKLFVAHHSDSPCWKLERTKFQQH